MNLDACRSLAEELMETHGLRSAGWHFGWDHGRRRFGACHYSTKTLTLSHYLVVLNSDEEVRNVILHEIAHALAPGHHHDWVWRSKARSIGCTGDRCYGSDVLKPKAPLTATCKNCGKVSERWKRARSPISCGRCSRTFDTRYLLEYKRTA
jgi:predicted SprT family Zn-dependent metalloprotease